MTSFKQAPDSQAAARKSENRFRTIFDQSPVSTQVFSADGTMLVANRAWEELWGVAQEQISGYNILRDPQLVDNGVMPLIERAFAGEAVEVPPIRYEPEKTIAGLSDVPYRWVEASLYPVRDDAGDIQEVVVMHQDITERLRVEEALRQSEERFRAIFEDAPVGISMVDAEGIYLAVNPMRRQMLGRSEQELLGHPYWEFSHPADREHDRQTNERARQERLSQFQAENRFIGKNGKESWARITVGGLSDEAGRPKYFISIAQDITEQKEAESHVTRLLELERTARGHVERLAAERAAILSQIAEGIIISDPEGRIVFVNEAARNLHGVERIGIPIAEYSSTYHLLTLDGRTYPPDELPLSRAVRGETVVDAEWRIRRPDGTEIVAQGSATPVIAESGDRLGAVLTIRDVTAQHELEQQKDDFLSAIAHDLRTPLTTVKGRVQLLQHRIGSETADTTRLLDDLKRIDANTNRMLHLINELLDVANLQLGRPLSLAPGPTDIIALVRAVAFEHQSVIDKHPISVEAEDEEVVGVWDAVRIERVLGNLLSNAVKYSPEGGDIRVRVLREGNEAVLSVSDHGIGIPEADLPVIFDRFHRGGNATGKIPGTGIGLAAVREIVLQHRGTISVDSREGQGTTFTIRLPLDMPHN